MIVFLFDKKDKKYCFTQTIDNDLYWAKQFDLIDDLRYSYHYISNEEMKQDFKDDFISQGYEEDYGLETRIIRLSHK